MRKLTASAIIGLALTLSAQAQFTYVTNNGTITITKYIGSGGDVTIPDSINGLPVTNIRQSAFARCTNLTSITIPNTVLSIGDTAFWGCSSLTSVVIPNSVTSIGTAVFSGCTSLTNLTIANSVTSIGPWAFSYCRSLFRVTIPNSVTAIGDLAFDSCTSLTSVMIPNSVTSIGNSAFDFCISLTSVTIPNSVTSLGPFVFSSCWSLTNVTIGNSVTNIDMFAFADCTNLMGLYFNGNAPARVYWPGNGIDNAIVYYLPGTTGWGETFGGRPAVLWNPQMQTSASPTALPSQFGFTITGTTNIPIVVEASANPAPPSWSPLLTCTLTNGSIYFSDPQWTNYPSRFYRIRSP